MVTSSDNGARLRGLLMRMEEICCKIEEVAQAEQRAARELDAPLLSELTERRCACQVELYELEAACRELVSQHETSSGSSGLTLEAFIDTCLHEDAPVLQALRRKLYLELLRLEGLNEASYLYLHAASDVSTAILHAAGLDDKETTYGPGGSL